MKLKILVAAVIAMMAAPGCTTSLNPIGQSAAPAPSVERKALQAAASNVAATNWPKPENISLTSRLAGVSGASKKRTTKSDAVNAYARSLSRRGEPVSLLAADAENHLAAARELISLAEMATNAIRPTMSDVATLEKAISDLRESREIYVATLKKVAGDDDTRERERLALLRDEFGEVISQIGEIADLLAEKADKDRTETFAQPSARKNLRS